MNCDFERRNSFFVVQPTVRNPKPKAPFHHRKQVHKRELLPDGRLSLALFLSLSVAVTCCLLVSVVTVRLLHEALDVELLPSILSRARLKKKIEFSRESEKVA